MPFFIMHYKNKMKEEVWDKIVWADASIGFNHNLWFFRGSAVILYCFINHSGAVPVLNSLKNNKIRQRIDKVITRTIIIQYILYIAIAISGFLTAPLPGTELIVFRKNLLFSKDWFMIIGQMMLVIMLIFVIPIKYNTLRMAILNLFFGNSEFSLRK